MELRQIRHFLAVAEHKQFGRAAEAVSLSQQALSHSVATLEADLQVKLFERGRFGAELTPMGRLFEKRARMACGELDFAAAELMAFKGGVDGQLRIGITPNFAADVAPDAVLLFAKARPRIRVSVTVGTSKQLFELLTAGKIELAFTSPLASPDPESGLEHRPLNCAYQHALNIVSMKPGHPLSSGRIDIAGLGQHRWCIPDGFTKPWEDVFSLIRNAGGEGPRYVVRTDCLDLAKALIMRSDFISLLGLESVRTEVEAGLIVVRDIGLPTRSVQAFVTHLERHALQPASSAIISCFERATRALSKEYRAEPATKEVELAEPSALG